MRRTLSFILTATLTLTIAAACRQADSSPPPNTQATIDAAVAATDAAQMAVQATIDAAVQATSNAVQAATSPQPEATVPATFTPVPPESYATMSEEELAALIDEAVTAATEAAAQSATAATDAASDGTVTQEEVQAVEVYLAGADEAIAYADDLLNAYYGLYGDLAAEAIEELQEIEDSLEEIAENSAEIEQAVEELSEAVEAGVALADETIDQIETAAEATMAEVQAIQGQAQQWQTELQAVRDNHSLDMSAQSVGAHQEVLQQALEFLNQGQLAMADGQVSAAELADISQRGAQLSLDLSTSGLPALQNLSGNVEEITGSLANGNLIEAQTGLDLFQNSLNSIPSFEPPEFQKRLPQPEGDKPAQPDFKKPSRPGKN